jgi:hypothetical protein
LALKASQALKVKALIEKVARPLVQAVYKLRISELLSDRHAVKGARLSGPFTLPALYIRSIGKATKLFAILARYAKAAEYLHIKLRLAQRFAHNAAHSSLLRFQIIALTARQRPQGALPIPLENDLPLIAAEHKQILLLEQQLLKISISSSTLSSSTPTRKVTLPVFKKPPEVESLVA